MMTQGLYFLVNIPIVASQSAMPADHAQCMDLHQTKAVFMLSFRRMMKLSVKHGHGAVKKENLFSILLKR